MKNQIPTLALATLFLAANPLPSPASDRRAELEESIRTATAKFKALQEDADKRIPAETLKKAHAILLLDRTKAGFVFAYQGGLGVALTKDPKTGAWSAPAFMKAEEASLGFQVGVQQSFIVALFMDADAAKGLAASQMVLGGEARGTAGKDSAGTGTDEAPPSVLLFHSRDGLYGGAALKGGSIGPDESANRHYYGRAVTTREILFERQVKPSETAVELARTLQSQARPSSKAGN